MKNDLTAKNNLLMRQMVEVIFYFINIDVDFIIGSSLYSMLLL